MKITSLSSITLTAGCQNYWRVCIFYDEINIFQRVITLLLNIEITILKNWYVDNRLNFFLISEFCVDVPRSQVMIDSKSLGKLRFLAKLST